MVIDTSLDFRTDTPPRKDPDACSPSLRRYHKLLWSKPLPSGRVFTLEDTVPGHYLLHRSDLGEFSLSSDSVIPTFTRWGFAAEHPELFTKPENDDFMNKAYTIGGMMVFPAIRVDGKQNINGARGFNRRIADRLDLTLECIRRHYEAKASPLGQTLARYRAFFDLFESFTVYVDFFLLQDLVTADGSAVTFCMPCDDFTTPAVPQDFDTYVKYRRHTLEFLEARNRRIERYAGTHND
jgi:hypothetical protein